MDIPEVSLVKTVVKAEIVVGPNPEFFENAHCVAWDVQCDNVSCGEKGFLDRFNAMADAFVFAESHREWHANGMPEE